MHQLIPMARLFEHLGDLGHLTPDEVTRCQTDAVRLLQGFEPYIIVQALLNPYWEKVRAEVWLFLETEDEQSRLTQLKITKADILERIRSAPEVSPQETADVEQSLKTLADDATLSATQLPYLIPPHHPTALHAVVTLYLERARISRTGVAEATSDL